MREREKLREEKHRVYHGRSTQPRAPNTSEWTLLKGALWHSRQVLYVESADWTNDLRCWVSVGVCVGACGSVRLSPEHHPQGALILRLCVLSHATSLPSFLDCPSTLYARTCTSSLSLVLSTANRHPVRSVCCAHRVWSALWAPPSDDASSVVACFC